MPSIPPAAVDPLEPQPQPSIDGPRPPAPADDTDRPAIRSVGRVHVAPGLLGRGPANGGRPSEAATTVQTALLHLRDAGFEVVADAGGSWPPDVDQSVDPRSPTWLVTDDPADCAASRSGITTILVAPGTSGPGPARIRRCDRQVRNLAAAVLEILAADAMDEIR